MVKVMMVSAEGRKTDLFPESMTIREVLEELEKEGGSGIREGTGITSTAIFP